MACEWKVLENERKESHLLILSEWPAMYGGWTEIAVLYRQFVSDSFETYQTFKRSIITEFEGKVDVQNDQFGWIRLRIVFFKLLNNDDKNCKQNSTVN